MREEVRGVKVFIVMYFDVEDPVKVFSTREKAEEYIRNTPEAAVGYEEDYSIHEMEVE